MRQLNQIAEVPSPSAGASRVVQSLVAAAAVSALLLPLPSSGKPAGGVVDPPAVTHDGCPADASFVAVTVVEPYGWRGDGEERAVIVGSTSPADGADSWRTVATRKQVGTAFGLAYDRIRNQIYVAAYYRNAPALGPGGTGVIYRRDESSGDIVEWANLDGGPDHSGEQFRDQWNWIGKSGLGDIEVAEDAGSLLITNLYDRKIYRLSLPIGRMMHSFAHGAASESWSADARPFGLAVRDGWLYHGVVDSQESGTPSDPPAAYVYRSRLDGTDMTLVASVPLDYPRSPSWKPWVDDSWGRIMHPSPLSSQPMITDIEFRPSGDMIIGLRDRLPEMKLVTDYSWDIITGDLLPATRRDGSWQAIAEPEWYRDETALGDEATLGTLASVPGQDVVISSATNPDGDIHHPTGILWFDNTMGSSVGHRTIIDHLQFGQGWVQGAGDLEFMCVQPPTPSPTTSPTPSSTNTGTPDSPTTSTPTPMPSPSLQSPNIFLPLLARQDGQSPEYVLRDRAQHCLSPPTSRNWLRQLPQRVEWADT
jgi:hypothetical protein